ncbi:codeine O-demethylase-like [Glycine soja]|uniref:ABC transporter B family member 9 isoform B n=1 Tax=Glycine soja TaxID=3848 RepID=A0A445I8B8_GLYSO|nr:codeine O-demethylase-like [Glycine soja]RZB82290.1 ABC transporter B family member 9 isoform B [Glycine soja]
MVFSQSAISREEVEEAMSIQELIKKPLTSVPQRYIQLHNNEPSLLAGETFSHALPTINLKKLIHGEDIELELEKLTSACRDWGFFQLVEHGISSVVMKTLEDEVEGFFMLPMEEKMKYKVRPGDVEGYGTVIRSEDQKLDWGDRLFMKINPRSIRNPHLFPELPSSLRNILELYIEELQNLAMILMGLLGKTLKIEKRELEVFEDGIQNMRMTYYPPCPQPELVMGLSAHSDATGITILNQMNGVNGLQIKKDGVWIPVNVISEALVVNIGDIIEIMSNGAYKSVEHRATVNSEKERISVAMFFLPKFQSEIGPAVSLTNPEHPPLFKRIVVEEYIKDYFTHNKLNGKSYLEHMRITDDEKFTNASI